MTFTYELKVCKVAVGVITDICRAIDKEILPYTDEIVNHLLAALSNEELDNSVRSFKMPFNVLEWVKVELHVLEVDDGVLR